MCSRAGSRPSMTAPAKSPCARDRAGCSRRRSSTPCSIIPTIANCLKSSCRRISRPSSWNDVTRQAHKMTTSPSRTHDLAILAELERKVLWLASWNIHHANHGRENGDGLKVGGHQASSASLATIMTALYFHTLRPADRVAVKPHAAPNFHALQYLLGRQTREKLEDFRGYKGAQSYPSRTKDTDDVDFSTGSVGLGVAQTLFSSLAQDYVRAHGWGQIVDGKPRPEGRMIALLGDAELDEGNIFEAMLGGWKQRLRNCWWIVD